MSCSWTLPMPSVQFPTISFGLHSSIQEAFTALVKAYFPNIQLWLINDKYTTACRWLEIGIMAGCTISPLTFYHGYGSYHPSLSVGSRKRKVQAWVVAPSHHHIHGWYDHTYYNQDLCQMAVGKVTGEHWVGPDEDWVDRVKIVRSLFVHWGRTHTNGDGETSQKPKTLVWCDSQGHRTSGPAQAGHP